MRQFALALLILIAAPTIALGDAGDKLECEILVRRGGDCVEAAWEENGTVIRGSYRECWEAHCGGRRLICLARTKCRCTRKGYQDFGFGERIKYHWCK